jgi:hypothetical protein
VGDKPSDIEAGVAAGVRRLFLFCPTAAPGEGRVDAQVIDKLTKVTLPDHS